MITVLVVGPHAAGATAFAEGHPSVEILIARNGEEAIEKLARNRRIDAVLLLAGAETAELATAIQEEDPAAPTLFAPAAAGSLPSVRSLVGTQPKELLDAIARLLSS